MNASLFPHPLLELWICMKNKKTKKLKIRTNIRPYIMGSELRCQNFDLVKFREIIPRNPCLKKNQNAPRPSEHPPVMGKKCLVMGPFFSEL